MRKNLNSRAVLSAVLAVAVSSLFWLGSLSSYANSASSNANRDTAVPGLAKAPAGVLGGTGRISLNGISTEPGATVLSGSMIATGEDGIASVDLGPLGRCIVRPLTTITVSLSPGTAMIAARAKVTRLSVLRGELMVTSPGANRLLKSGEDAVFADSIEATMTGDTVFTVQDQGSQKDQAQKDAGAQQDPNNTGQNPSPSPSPSPKRRRTAVIVPWWGWLGMAAIAGGIAAGVATHGADNGANNGAPNRVSSPQP